MASCQHQIGTESWKGKEGGLGDASSTVHVRRHGEFTYLEVPNNLQLARWFKPTEEAAP